jgi:hypothetical protein
LEEKEHLQIHAVIRTWAQPPCQNQRPRHSLTLSMLKRMKELGWSI